mmetsp:Transcript_11139/g.18465  ORF Transcript_11139/g.18465 Transcript_11139/m.18465 type:complete len:466 (-) Transcript_11139:77-1474(-)
MASILSCIATGAVWCFCTATMSLFSSCCGNDKASNIPPSATSGRKRSVLLLLLTIAIAFAFQYGVGPYVLKIPISNYVTDAWTDGCTGFGGNIELQEQCVGNQGVYRATSSALVFFVLAAMAAYCKPTANREAWPAKYILFIFLTIATCFIPNDPLFSVIYLNIARTGGFFFVIVQQIIILDLAYNWNDSWVEKSNAADTESAQKRWLGAILTSCALLLVVSITGVALMFAYFTGCATNTAFISITIVMTILLLVLQLSGEEGSLLSSCIIGAYGTYLCYTAVSKNPNDTCNPQMGEEDVLGIILGIGITLLSLAWTGYSITAENRINGGDSDLEETLVVDEEKANKSADDEERKVTGVVTNNPDYGSTEEDSTPAATASPSGDDADTELPTPVSWKLNLILALVSCFIAVSLTGWGSIEAGGNAANPDVSRVSMWMIVVSQWIVYILYAWSLAAPRLFPGRDFS